MTAMEKHKKTIKIQNLGENRESWTEKMRKSHIKNQKHIARDYAAKKERENDKKTK